LKLLNFKLITFIGFSITFLYFFEFYFINNEENYFWCVQILENFQIQDFKNIKLPIHCDEGPYQEYTDIVSADHFFDRNNPYQQRPLYMLVIALIRLILSEINFFSFSNYQIFRISIFVLQFIILFSIIKVFIRLLNLDLNNYKNYLLIFSVIAIPSIRWNMFFPSVGNLTLLFLLISLFVLSNKKVVNSRIFMTIGLLSLAHSSAIIYGLIILLILFLRKEIKANSLIKNFIFLIFFQIFYNIIVGISNYNIYDWHREIYGQFYWIIRAFLNQPPLQDCQTFSTFYICNNETTLQYLSYFSFIIITFLLLVLILNKRKIRMTRLIQNNLLINIFIFLFWSFQGYYESFRFVNYSIGYFIFLSIIFIAKNLVNKNIFLILFLISYEFSVYYLEPYSLMFQNLNPFIFISIIFYLIFIYLEFFKNNLEPGNYSESTPNVAH